MTNQEYYDAYVSDIVDTLSQLSNKDIIKLVLEQHRCFVLEYNEHLQQSDMLGMSIVEYHKYIEETMDESL